MYFVSDYKNGSGARLSQGMPAKVGKLVNQALTKAWTVENADTMEIVKNMVKFGNFVSVWKFFGKDVLSTWAICKLQVFGPYLPWCCKSMVNN